jgi:hypothetical protein
MSKIKRQIQDEVSRILMSTAAEDNRDKSNDGIDKTDEVDELFEQEGISVVSTDDEEAYGPNGNPFEDEAALVWGDGDNHSTSIELIPENMENMKKYYFEWNGNKMYAQKKSVGTDKFEIGIFQDEPE